MIEYQMKATQYFLKFPNMYKHDKCKSSKFGVAHLPVKREIRIVAYRLRLWQKNTATLY